MQSICAKLIRGPCFRLLRRSSGRNPRSPQRCLSVQAGHTAFVSILQQTGADEQVYDISRSNLPQAERRLLGRARLHGIFNPTKLEFEADVGHTQDVGSKMTDTHEHRQDFELWKLIMDVNKQRNGIDGLKATWRGMRHRGVQVQLDSKNATALEIWETFITTAAVEDLDFLQIICWNCIDSEILEDRIFVDVVSTLLRHQPRFAPQFARSLRSISGLGRDEQLTLFQTACDSNAEGSLQAFRDLSPVLPEMRLYRDIVPYLCQLGRTDDALHMHKHLLTKRDLPKTFDDLTPLIEYFAATGMKMDAFLHDLRAAGVSFDSQIKRLYSRRRARIVGFHPETMNIVASHTFGMKPRNLSDQTMARAFATPGVSFDFMLKFFQPFGLIELGPLAVRQMAMTSADIHQLRSRFEKLEEFGIDLGSSAYVRMMKKLAHAGPDDMVFALSRTDMHHDEFEDRALQTNLLGQYVEKRDLVQVNQSLAILNYGDVNAKAQLNATNLMFRAALNQQDWPSVLRATATAERHNQRISKLSLQMLDQKLSTLWYQNDAVDGFDRVGLVIGIFQRLLVAGNAVQPSLWVKPTLELGRQGRLDEVDCLLLWLAQYYQEVRKNGVNVDRILETDTSKLFSTAMTNAVVSWGITRQSWADSFAQASQRTSSPPPEPWLRGAVLLKTLQDQFGVQIDVVEARAAFDSRLKMIYYSDLRPVAGIQANRHCAKMNGIQITDCLRSWSRFWDQKDFW